MNIKKTLIILTMFLLIIVSCGCTESTINSKDAAQPLNNNTPDPQEVTYYDSEWAKNITETTPKLINDANNVSTAAKNTDWYLVSIGLQNYKSNLENAIKNVDSYSVSPDLKDCQNEYKAGLMKDYDSVLMMQTGINLLTNGNLKSSTEAFNQATEDLRLANGHYDNVTRLVKIYNAFYPERNLVIPVTQHTISSPNTVSTPAETATTPITKTLADKEPESTGIPPSEDSKESTNSVESSTDNIFNYCTWQAQLTKKVGEYYKAPENKSYVVVTIKINNTGSQTYSTNPFNWHLKIGDLYYQPDTATFDSSMNQMTTDVGPGGKITTKIAYLVDGEPSTSDLNLYYDGPGSDGIINS